MQLIGDIVNKLVMDLGKKMVTWYNTVEKLPENNQDCIIMSENGGIAGPIKWKATENSGMWVDIFATYEAGTAYSTDIVKLWADWDKIKPTDEKMEEAGIE